jgi:hypothetical protein
VKEHRVAGLHVDGAAAVQLVAVAARRHVVGDRNGVEVAGEQHTRRTAQVRPGQHRIAVPNDLESAGLFAQGGLDLLGDGSLVPRLARDVDQRSGQRNRVASQIQAHRAQG